jgi:hypothetical protein
MADEQKIETKVPEHIQTLRLLDSSRGDLAGKFHLENWELKHLADCEECQDVRRIFMRQFTTMKKDAA